MRYAQVIPLSVLCAACSAEKALREKRLFGDQQRTASAMYNSVGSDRSSINSAAGGMRIASPYDACVWVQAGPDAQDADYAFEELRTIKQMPGKPEFHAFVKAGYEVDQHGGKDVYNHGSTDGHVKDSYVKYNKGECGGVQDERYHTQADSYEEDESGRSLVMKDRDPVSVLPSHLYSTDDEHSTQHAVSGSNSAQTNPNTSMYMSGRAASLHLPSISDIYAVISQDQKADATAQHPQNDPPIHNNGGSIHYQEYEPSNVALAPINSKHAGMALSGYKPGNSTSPIGLLGQPAEGFGPQDAYMADAVVMQQVNEGLAYGQAGTSPF